jgi:hypothetical protein
MTKKEAMERWAGLKPNQKVLPHMTPLPAASEGSTYGACGIRITGNPEFVDAVLSRLKDLLEAEGETTRLHLARAPIKDTSEKQFHNRDGGAESCYIQVRERARPKPPR